MTGWLTVKLLGGISVITKGISCILQHSLTPASTTTPFILGTKIFRFLRKSLSPRRFMFAIEIWRSTAQCAACECLCVAGRTSQTVRHFSDSSAALLSGQRNQATICIQTAARTCGCRGRQEGRDSTGGSLAASSLILFAVEQIILATCCRLAFWQCLPMKRLLIWTTLSCHLARWRETGIKGDHFKRSITVCRCFVFLETAPDF